MARDSQGFFQVSKGELVRLLRDLIKQRIRESDIFVVLQLLLPPYRILSSFGLRGVREWAALSLSSEEFIFQGDRLTTSCRIAKVDWTKRDPVVRNGSWFRSASISSTASCWSSGMSYEK